MMAAWAFVNPSERPRVGAASSEVTGCVHTEVGKAVMVGQQGRRRGQV